MDRNSYSLQVAVSVYPLFAQSRQCDVLAPNIAIRQPCGRNLKHAGTRNPDFNRIAIQTRFARLESHFRGAPGKHFDLRHCFDYGPRP